MLGNRKLQVQTIDIAGNMVYNNVQAGGQINIDVSHLTNGVYVIRV